MLNICGLVWLWVLSTPLLVLADNSDVAGPVVKLVPPTPAGTPPAPSNETKTGTIAETINNALKAEFNEETTKAESEAGKEFNSTLLKEEGKAETVVRITANQDSKPEVTPNSTTSGTDDQWSEGSSTTSVEKSTATIGETHADVDRIIDSRDNEFVLSKSKEGIASLTLDPLLIQDLSFVLGGAGCMGLLFESIKQPVINGYLMAGALVGPGGLQLIKELVQVESLAQLGVQLLLFGLGLELSTAKLRAVWGVAILGGTLQIVLPMVITGIIAAVFQVPVMQGVFIGALLSMSSTSVVVKCLEKTKSTNTVYGQITIGTLILQDCFVGLMFALMPLFSIKAIADADGPDHRSAIAAMILQVLVKLVLVLTLAYAAARAVLPLMLRLLFRHASRELVQLLLVGVCLMSGWASGKIGLSEELGAFLAGATINMAEAQLGHHLVAAASAGAFGNLAVAHAAQSHEHFVARTIEGVENVMTALFIASIGLVMPPKFLWDHILVLTCCTMAVLVVKSLLVTLVVQLFGMTPRTSLAVGVSLAHIGEFSFVLLSMADQAKILPQQVSMLLLGVTGLSLLTTPSIIFVTNRLLYMERSDAAPSLVALKGISEGGRAARYTNAAYSPYAASGSSGGSKDVGEGSERGLPSRRDSEGTGLGSSPRIGTARNTLHNRHVGQEASGSPGTVTATINRTTSSCSDRDLPNV